MHHHFEAHQKLSYAHIYRYLNWLYKELYFTKKKVLALILPYPIDEHKIISALHKKLIIKYGFNYINIHEYYEQNECLEFGRRIDPHHQQQRIMREFGKNIIANLDSFHHSKPLKEKNDNPSFQICTPKEMRLLSGNLEDECMQNSAFKEQRYKIEKGVSLAFEEKYKDYHIIGVHSWNEADSERAKWWGDFIRNYASIILQNKTCKFSKEAASLNQFIEVQKPFIIDDESVIRLNDENLPPSEYHN